MPLVTAVIDPEHPLMVRRRALVEQLADVDRQIAANASTSVRDALVAATTTPASLPAPAATKLLPQSAGPRRPGAHVAADRAAVLGVKHEREIKTALVAGALSAKAIAQRAGLKRDDVKRAIKQLFALGVVSKNGSRGPSVTWRLATGSTRTTAAATARAHRAAAADDDQEFETVWPPKDNPRAPVSAVLQSARA